MNSKGAKVLLHVLMISLLVTGTLRAQSGGVATLSGAVTNPAEQPSPTPRSLRGIWLPVNRSRPKPMPLVCIPYQI